MAYDNGLRLVSDGIGDRAMRTVLDAFIKIIEKESGKGSALRYRPLPDYDRRHHRRFCKI